MHISDVGLQDYDLYTEAQMAEMAEIYRAVLRSQNDEAGADELEDEEGIDLFGDLDGDFFENAANLAASRMIAQEWSKKLSAGGVNVTFTVEHDEVDGGLYFNGGLVEDWNKIQPGEPLFDAQFPEFEEIEVPLEQFADTVLQYINETLWDIPEGSSPALKQLILAATKKAMGNQPILATSVEMEVEFYEQA